jgi:hypothetical protein
MSKTVLLAACTLLLLTCASANAALKLNGAGENMQADISAFPPDMKSAYDLFKVKCIKCHGLDRSLLTIQSGMAPSGAVFDIDAVDAYGAKMLRKPDSGMNKKELKIIMDLLRYMVNEAEKP